MTQAEVAEFVTSLRRTFTDVEALPMPTIAVLEGYAGGGGAELALSCDLRVADSTAVLVFPEARLGIMPGAGGTQRLARLVGLSAAKVCCNGLLPYLLLQWRYYSYPLSAAGDCAHIGCSGSGCRGSAASQALLIDDSEPSRRCAGAGTTALSQSPAFYNTLDYCRKPSFCVYVFLLPRNSSSPLEPSVLVKL